MQELILNNVDFQYHNRLKALVDLADNEPRSDRTGVGTYSRFGTQLRFNLATGFPLLTTKKVQFHSVVVELLWFLKGHTNIKYLHDHDVHIWDEWADEKGELGPVYGAQWRNWQVPTTNGEPYTVDQIKNVIESIKNNPFSRRHIVTAWNPADVDKMALPPCHLMFQFYVSRDLRLSCHMYQRSADWFLGVPFNIASYALLTQIIATHCGLDLGDLIISFGDYHLYSNHIDAAKLQLQRTSTGPECKVRYGGGKRLDEIEPSDFELIGYNPHSWIRASIAV